MSRHSNFRHLLRDACFFYGEGYPGFPENPENPDNPETPETFITKRWIFRGNSWSFEFFL